MLKLNYKHWLYKLFCSSRNESKKSNRKLYESRTIVKSEFRRVLPLKLPLKCAFYITQHKQIVLPCSVLGYSEELTEIKVYLQTLLKIL